MYPIICEHCGKFIYNPFKSRKCRNSINSTRGRFCRRHCYQLKTYKEFKDSIQTPHKQLNSHLKSNPYVVIDNYVKFEIFDVYGVSRGFGLISLDDINIIKTNRWYLNNGGYIFNKKLGPLHKLICKSDLVDHINRNKLDNRRENLRPADKSLNAVNTDLRRSNSSGITGVYYSKRGFWVAQFQYKGNRLAYKASDKLDAIKQRLLWEREYLGDFAPQKHLFAKYLDV